MGDVFRACVFGLAAVVLLAPQAPAQELEQGPYAIVGGSLVMPKDVSGHGDKLRFENGFGINVSGGYGFENFVLDLEVGYRSAEVDALVVDGARTPLSDLSIDFTSWSFMANTYFDLPIDGGLIAYVGGGLGLSLVEIEASRAVPGLQLAGSKADTAFAYQFMAGAAYALTEGMELFAGYRFTGSSYESADVHTHDVEGGLRFVF